MTKRIGACLIVTTIQRMIARFISIVIYFFLFFFPSFKNQKFHTTLISNLQYSRCKWRKRKIKGHNLIYCGKTTREDESFRDYSHKILYKQIQRSWEGNSIRIENVKESVARASRIVLLVYWSKWKLRTRRKPFSWN